MSTGISAHRHRSRRPLLVVGGSELLSRGVGLGDGSLALPALSQSDVDTIALTKQRTRL